MHRLAIVLRAHMHRMHLLRYIVQLPCGESHCLCVYHVHTNLYEFKCTWIKIYIFILYLAGPIDQCALRSAYGLAQRNDEEWTNTKNKKKLHSAVRILNPSIGLCELWSWVISTWNAQFIAVCTKLRMYALKNLNATHEGNCANSTQSNKLMG